MSLRVNSPIAELDAAEYEAIADSVASAVPEKGAHISPTHSTTSEPESASIAELAEAEVMSKYSSENDANSDKLVPNSSSIVEPKMTSEDCRVSDATTAVSRLTLKPSDRADDESTTDVDTTPRSIDDGCEDSRTVNAEDKPHAIDKNEQASHELKHNSQTTATTEVEVEVEFCPQGQF